MLMIFLILGGVIAGLQLRVQQIPNLDLRTIVITSAVPGASPKEIEEDINRRIEESVVGLAGVARVVSVASQGFTKTEIEVETFADPGTVLDSVKTAVDSIENFPPPSAEAPRIEIKKLSVEVMAISVSSQHLSEDALRGVAENIRDELLNLPAVSLVRLRGTRDREISIELSETELRRYGLSLAEVARKVRHSSLNLTSGELHTDGGSLILHVVNKKKVGKEFKNIPLITRPGGAILTLGDVAEIHDGFVDEDVRSEVDGKPTLFLRVEASDEQSLLEVAKQVKGWFAKYESPPGVEIGIWNDRVVPIFDRFSKIIHNAVIGIILVFVCLLLVFDLRVAIWITVGIPLSFVASLLFFDISNLTLNMGTMFAFFVLIGIVVDDAVVVGDNIVAERERGKNALDAAISGARAVVGPLVVAVLTTVLAFVPFMFVTTGSYQIIKVFPLVAFFVLLISLVEAFFILPAHLSHEKRWGLSPLRDVQERVRSWIDEMRDAIVVPIVSWSVRHIFMTFLIGVVFVIAAAWLVRSEAVRVVVFDRSANAGNTIEAHLELPVGSPFDTSAAVAQRFAQAAGTINDQLDGNSIKSISLIVGRLGDRAGTQTGGNESIRSHLATVTLKLHERPVRQASVETIEQAWRQNLDDIQSLEKVSIQTTRLRFKPSVAYALVHQDPGVLRKATDELRSFISTIPGIYAPSDSLTLGKRHFEIELTPTGEVAGLTPALIGKQLRANLHGIEVQRIQRGREEIRVVVRYPAERRGSLRDLANERIYAPGGSEIPLLTAARITEKRELAKLTRIDGKQAALVNGQADISRITPAQARRKIAEEFLPDLMEKYPGLEVSRDGGAREERALIETLGVLFSVVIILIYALIAGLLRSYWKPLVAIFGVPIACGGAVFGHWVLGWDLTAVSLFGMIGVAGVIVNDALVLIDRYNTIRREHPGIPAIAAASGAARDRFRAVFLTSVTTVLGLSPLLYERSDELLFLVPFAVSMLGGLVAAAASTLFLLPALVMLVEGRREV